ncbi:MAG: hypothetical protein IJC55_04885 [Clostridia bacterium]|nr:hypothetical protein [Clostridia bacterium]
MNREQFHIGTYFLQPYARTEQHIRELAECGIDLVFGMEYHHDTLELFLKYRIGAIVNGVVPGWFGANGDNAGTLASRNPLKLYESAAKEFSDHPAIWGIDVGDEPSALDFPYYGKVIERMQSLFPNQFSYLNLYPSYGLLADNTKEQIRRELGTENYRDYLQRYCNNIDTDYLSFDHYAYSSSPKRLIEDLRVAAEVCRENKRSLWVVLQANSHQPNYRLSQDQLRFQAYSALVFGARCISWACYTAGWWHHNVLDETGQKTDLYQKLKTVNQEVRAMTLEYPHYQWQKTMLLNRPSNQNDWGWFREIHIACDHPSVFMGCFVKQTDEGYAVMLYNDSTANGSKPQAATVCFSVCEEKTVRLYSPNGVRRLVADGDNKYRVVIAPDQGCFITTQSQE